MPSKLLVAVEFSFKKNERVGVRSCELDGSSTPMEDGSLGGMSELGRGREGGREEGSATRRWKK